MVVIKKGVYLLLLRFARTTQNSVFQVNIMANLTNVKRSQSVYHYY